MDNFILDNYFDFFMAVFYRLKSEIKNLNYHKFILWIGIRFESRNSVHITSKNDQRILSQWFNCLLVKRNPVCSVLFDFATDCNVLLLFLNDQWRRDKALTKPKQPVNKKICIRLYLSTKLLVKMIHGKAISLSPCSSIIDIRSWLVLWKCGNKAILTFLRGLSFT